MKRKIKYIIFAFIVVFSSFVVSTTTDISKSEKKTIAVVDSIPVEETIDISVENFPEHKTQKVSHKLDSLLNRINKRHDFHGALLVAKNGKVVYNNQMVFSKFFPFFNVNFRHFIIPLSIKANF